MALKYFRPTSTKPEWLHPDSKPMKLISSGGVPDFTISSNVDKASAPRPWREYPVIIVFQATTSLSPSLNSSKQLRAFRRLPHLAYIATSAMQTQGFLSNPTELANL
ncbi:unnamed protein product [Spirodela intermedia]|uniref:Uncharacterized protein n=1 Tax=Spirodela intermedia TaxID=51605 RepID=A0ABN7EB98_SPIIN|nr:unnamed protein product [Spirodela intermedia]